MATTTPDAVRMPLQQDRIQPVHELRDSVFLLALAAMSLGTYVALGVLVVRLLAGGR